MIMLIPSQNQMKMPTLQNNQYDNVYSRSAMVRPASVDEENRSISGVMATEQPVMVWDWARFEPIREILLMDGVVIPKQLPLLDAHSRFSTSDIIGSVRDIELVEDDKGNPILTAKNFFSSTAEREWTLVKEGHLTDTSIGYVVNDRDSETIKPGETKEINGREFTNDYEDKAPLVIRTSWTLKENSCVPIGADDRAKFRSQFTLQPELASNENETNEYEPKTARSTGMRLNIHKHLKLRK